MAESIINMAPTPAAIPATDIQEIILMALCDFLEIKYLHAMKNETFISTKVVKNNIYDLMLSLDIQ